MEDTMKKSILALMAGLFVLAAARAEAYVAYETSPGTIEIRGTRDQGLAVRLVQERKIRGKSWVYFCVVDRAPQSKIKREKCFYGNPSTFKGLRVGSVFRSIEYGLKNRVHNSLGQIAIGSQMHFYPAYVLYKM